MSKTSAARALLREYVIALREATGEVREAVDGSNWQHLEVGNTYECTVGRERVEAVFKGWVGKDGRPTDSESPEEVNLKFADVGDGMEWEAYWHRGRYVAGSSADTLYVEEK